MNTESSASSSTKEAIRSLNGKRVLFVTSINPIRMPFVSQQIALLKRHGMDVRTITRTTDTDHERSVEMLYEGFLDAPATNYQRIRALGLTVADDFLARSRSRFLKRASNLEKLGKLTAAKQIYHWRKILALINDWRPDLIHTHFAWHLPFSIPLAEYLNIPLICTAHHSDIYFEDNWAEDLSNPAVTRVITIAESVHSYIMQQCPSLSAKTFLIYNPINPDFISSAPPAIRTSHILNVAAYKKIKNQAWLIRSLKRLQDWDVTFHCDLVGVGDELENCKRLACELGVEKNITFHGFKSHTDVMTLMDRSAVFVLTSESEGLPTVITEALSRELPVIATDLPSTRDATSNGKFSTLIPLDDDDLLANALRETLAASPQKMRTQSGREWIIQEFSPDAHGRKLFPLYAQVLNRQCHNSTDVSS